MILTTVPPDRLAAVASVLARQLDAPARCVLARIADPRQAERATGAAAEHHHSVACELAAGFGMGLLPGVPAIDFAWNGSALRSGTEAYVLLHEVAHFQLATQARRGAIDFGLGAGPETGNREAADRAATVFGVAREREEAMASLLGVLWEVELGQPGFASFLDQNWLEGAGRSGTATYFSTIVDALAARGLIDAQGSTRRCVTALS